MILLIYHDFQLLNILNHYKDDKLINLLFQKSYIKIFIIVTASIWVAASIVDTLMTPEIIGFWDILILKTPKMLLFHRFLFLLIAWFVTSLILLYNVSKQLRRSENKLKKLNKTKDKLFSIISHDIKSPFTGFLGLSETLKEDFDDLSREEIKEIGQSMFNTSKKVFEYMENLLSWARIQLNEIKFNPININLYTLITTVQDVLNLNLIIKKIDFKINVDYNLHVFADSQMLHSIFRNVISNAIKFSNPEGKIAVYVDIADPELSMVEIKVVDQGIGIDPKKINNLFDADSSYTRVGTQGEQGTGLGLVICKEMVEKNHGSISIDSEPGKGTTVKINLPLEK